MSGGSEEGMPEKVMEVRISALRRAEERRPAIAEKAASPAGAGKMGPAGRR